MESGVRKWEEGKGERFVASIASATPCVFDEYPFHWYVYDVLIYAPYPSLSHTVTFYFSVSQLSSLPLSLSLPLIPTYRTGPPS